MPKTICPQRLNHFNLVLADFHASLGHFKEVYGADFLMDLPGEGFHAGLFEIGRVVFEIFSPDHWLMNARYGAHYLGVEYRANMEEVREAIAARGIRIVRDIGLALHTHPDDTFGVALEFYDGSFHEMKYELLGGNQMRSAAYWQDEHPLGLTGLKRYSLAVGDVDGARGFLQEFLSAEVIYQETRPAIGAKAIGMKVAGSVVELLTPVATGTLQQHHNRYGDGIRSVVFGVRSLQTVGDYFRRRNMKMVSGDAPGALAVLPEANRGIVFEFSE